MTKRELTPIEIEAAAILEADIRVRLGDAPVTASTLKAALIESVATLARPLDTREIIVERDPHDDRRVSFLVPLGWFAAGLIQRRAGQ
jgi:hypothetical protein